MTLTNVLPYIQRAQREGWAVGAFNTVNMEQAQAIAWAAEAEAAPAIIQVSHRALVYIGSGDAAQGLTMMAAVGKAAAESVRAPISLHLDHGSADEVRQALALGFTSVMYDAGSLPLAENIAITRQLAAEAHAHGACIEAEVGEVPRLGQDNTTRPAEGLTNPAEAAEFTRSAGVDTLAIAIGSVHAVKSKIVTLDLERLRAIRAVVDLPLVLHGSSGVTDASIQAGIALGLAKINVATQLSLSFTMAVRSALATEPSGVDLRPYLSAGRAAMIDAVRERIRLLGACGRAA